MRHSLAHIMAAAIQQLWPKAMFGVGPVVVNGFYYDVDIDTTLTLEDLSKIEAKMGELIKQDLPFERFELPIDKAIEQVTKQGQRYKIDLLKDLRDRGTTNLKDVSGEELGVDEGEAKVTTVNFYHTGQFEDLCRGPHVESTGKVGAFKLTKVSGAYWRGDQKNPQLQRIYGVGFETKDELGQYLTMLEEAEKRDHRKLGQELDLFTFSDLIGPGLPLWTPRGTVLRRELDRFVQELREQYDYQEVAIPHITKKEAYEKSGHWEKFSDELFNIKSREGHQFAMKPMNCPHHIQIYDARPRSYRELPVRYRETTMVYRDEQTGELSGLERVRSVTQDDAHVFCRRDQIETEALKIWEIIDQFYSKFGFKLTVRFSRHEPDQMAAYSGEEADWQQAEAQLKQIIWGRLGDDYLDGLGDAAFYGPKIDFIGEDALGRKTQVATIQLDFNQPEGFDLTTINEKGEEERIVMIHAAIMGSIERFLSVYLEHSAGIFPVWLAPEQVRLATVNDDTKIMEFAHNLRRQFKQAGIRSEIDSSNESVGKKIRAAQLMKVPYTIVVGEKEVESGQVSPRSRHDLAEIGSMPIEDFKEHLSRSIHLRQ